MANMKRPLFGPSIYYATDKNIFDALNEHKVDTATVIDLFERRNTLVSKKTPRDRLAEYFARLTHDYFDHQEIAQRLGVMPRRERLTSVDLIGVENASALISAIDEVAEKWKKYGDVIEIDRKKDNVSVTIQYSVVDYGRSEFNQVQVRDGVVDFHLEGGSYVVRSTKNARIDDFRDAVISSLSTAANVEQRSVSLFAYNDARVRSDFFYDLFSGLPGLELVDVTDVYVYKATPDEDDLEDSFVERVSLKGKGVSRSEFLNELDSDGYYTFRVAWRAKEVLGRGDEFDIEAVFADPVGCTGFSFLLLGVYERVDGVVSAKRRLPLKNETIRIAQAVEGRARELIAALGAPTAGGGDD
jgi:hypothetical protein